MRVLTLKIEMETLLVLAAIGFIALVAGFLYGAWWLLTHIPITP